MTDYSKLVDDLRDIEKTMFALGTSPINMDNVSIRLAYDKRWGPTANDAADAIEALQAELIRICKQLPKRGEIVRCGECKYHMAETERTNPYCNKYHCMRTDDWFCSDGEMEVRE